jgi:1-acyl-sn-glycerol-3-phosphate acyltransferase
MAFSTHTKATSRLTQIPRSSHRRQSNGDRRGVNTESEVRGKILNWVQPPGGSQWGTDPGAFDPVMCQALVERMGALYGPRRYFGLDVQGWENLPDHPVMLISNHSGGTTIPDVWGFAYAWVKRFGTSRICHALAHELVFSSRTTSSFFSRLGVLRASRQQAIDVLTRWKRDVLVMPGGDRDTWRPWKDRYKVNFAGRKGYARIALRTGTPVVPVANAGAHSSLIVLADGHRFAEKIGLHALTRASVFPVHLSVPWGLGIGPLPHLPLPVTLRYRIGAPIALPEHWVPCETPPEDLVAEYDARVQAGVQALLNQLEAERAPLLKRLRLRAR